MLCTLPMYTVYTVFNLDALGFQPHLYFVRLVLGIFAAPGPSTEILYGFLLTATHLDHSA